MSPVRSPGPLSRISVLLFSGLFALVFGAGGWFAGVMPLARTLHAAWLVQSWQPVPAQVVSSSLSVSAGCKGGSTYKAQVRYRYRAANGQEHESGRIGLDPSGGSDNIGEWQRDWSERLAMARDRGEAVTAWVNPDDPSEAVLDRSIRWPLLIFRLPFAFVFTGVGLVAAWVFVRALTGAGNQGVAAAGARSSASKGQAALWLFALFWCGISFPLAAVFWLGRSPWWVNLLVSVFVLVGLGLLWVAVRQSLQAWRYAGTGLVLQPSPPRAGETVDVVLSLSARAIGESVGGVGGHRLRLSQYRVDDSGSGSSERLVEQFVQIVKTMPDPGGGARWQARFDVPADAPTHGSRRSGERVDWRLEVLGEGETVEVSFDVPVASAPAWSTTGAATPDRFDRRARWSREEPIAGPAEGLPVSQGPDSSHSPQWPATVSVRETPDACEWRFAQPGWRWLGALALFVCAVLTGLWWREDPLSSGRAVWLALLLGLGLHAVSRRRSLTLRDDAVEVRVMSWMGTRTRCLAPSALDHLFHKVLYTQSGGSGRSTTEFHAVHARETGSGPAVRLTPGLAGAASAVAVGQALQAARAHRSGRFSAGASRSDARSGWRPGAGWVLWAAMLGVVCLRWAQ